MATGLFASFSPPLQQHEQSTVISPIMSGAPSIASGDGMSVVSGITSTFPQYLTTARPPPEYISLASAAQVATDYQRAQRDSISDEEEASPERERTAVSENAIGLVNAFLDKLLYDFLYTARSASLLALKPAVAEVLKKTLARDAVASADANLEDLLALEDEEEDERPKTPKESPGKWNMEYIWKRARLRVMMRSEKSDFDIDDDERHVQEQGLLSPGRRWSQSSGTISLSAEIFLAGVLDYLAEQLISGAVHPATTRSKRQSRNSRTVPGAWTSYHVMVEEQDVEKGVLNSPMDRLWRNWRKSLRSRGLGRGRGNSIATTGSPSIASPNMGRRGSEAFETGSVYSYAQGRFASDSPEQQFPEHILASNIPLPIGGRDVDEIEVPGLAKDPDAKDESRPSTAVDLSRRSLVPGTLPGAERTMLANAEQQEMVSETIPRPAVRRRRSSSVPSPLKPRYKPSAIQAVDLASESAHTESAVANDENTFSMNVNPKSPDTILPISRSQVSSTGAATIDAPQSAQDIIRNSSIIRDRSNENLAVSHAEASHEPTSAISDGAQEQDQIYKGAFRERAESDTFGRNAQNSMAEQSPILENGTSKKTRRNREAAVGLGDPSGISMPPGTAPVSMYNQRVGSRDGPTAYDTASKWDSESSYLEDARPGSSQSDSAESDLPKTPREFLASRKLSSTRSERQGQSPGRVEKAALPRTITPSAGDFERSIKDFSPGVPKASSPTIPQENSQEFRPRNNTHVDLVQSARSVTRTPPLTPPQTSEDFPSKSKPSPIRKQSVLADGDSSERRGSVRRVGVERNGSIVSTLSAMSFGKSKKPLTSASITSPADFDMFVQGDETIKYTLTPDAARDSPSRASIVRQMDSRGRSSDELTRRGSSKGTDAASIKEARGRTSSVATSQRSLSRPAARNKSATRAGLLAREPTVQTDSTRDFSDFIRSTGPDKEPQTLVPALTSRSQTSLHSTRSSNVAQAATSGRNPSISSQLAPVTGRTQSISSLHGAGRKSSEVPPMPSGRTGSLSGPRSHLKAREATTVNNSDGDIVDFIRNGPHEKGAVRNSKDVAPWAMDIGHDKEADFGAVAGQRGAETSNGEGGNDFSIQGGKTPSTGSVGLQSFATQSTVKSRAPLLPDGASNAGQVSQPAYGSQVTQPAYAVQSSRLNVPSVIAGPSKSSDGGRKRYRNKDPYAIDFSDDDDDDLLTALPPQIKPDEGLAEFLRNSDVPVNNAPPTLATSKAADQARFALQERAQRQSPTMQTKPQYGGNAGPSTSSPPLNGLAQNGVSTKPAYNPSVAESSRTNDSETTIRPAQIRSQISAGNSVPQVRKPTGAPKMQVRAAGAPRSARMNALHETSTGDLADFLRSSGPPMDHTPARREVSGGAPAPVVGQGRGGAGAKDKVKPSKAPKFWQKKRYVDMP